MPDIDAALPGGHHGGAHFLTGPESPQLNTAQQQSRNVKEQDASGG
jgi:hypothetical protein